MKVPLRIGAGRAPKNPIPINPALPRTGKAGRIAGLSAAAAVVLGVGAASALFVDYLADRALARTVDDPVAVEPIVAAAIETTAEAKAASIAPRPAKPAPAAKEPAAAPIEAAMPEPEAIAKVAIGPEHAIELPAEDPTAEPTVKLAAVEPDGEEPLAFAGEPDQQAEDETRTAAIAPEEAIPEAAPEPRKPKTAKASPAGRETEVASLPGVDIGGLAGHPSDAAGEPESTVRTVTRPAAKNLGGVPAGAARVTAAVNMRSAPRKGAGVLAVVPAGSAVQVVSCDGWCKVSWDGRQGFVYKSYLAAAKAAPPTQAAGTAEAAEPARGVQSPRLN